MFGLGLFNKPETNAAGGGTNTNAKNAIKPGPSRISFDKIPFSAIDQSRFNEVDSRMNMGPDLSWQEVAPEKLKQLGIYKTDEKKKLQGKDVSLDRFTMPDGSSMALAPDLGANIMNLQLAGREIISSPLMKNKAAKNYVPDIQGAPLISPPNRTDQTKLFMPNGKTIELMPWYQKLWQKLPFTKKTFNYDHGNMIHGRIYKNKWSLDKAEMNQSGDLKVTYKFNTKDDPVLKKKFGEAEFKMAYIMMKDPVTGAQKMKTQVEVTNTGNKSSANNGVYPLVGLGFHPYIKIDKGTNFSAPVTQQYEVDKNLMPTGNLIPPEQSQIQSGIPASKKESGLIDTTYTGLLNNYTNPQLGKSYAQSIINLGDGGTIKVSQDNKLFNHTTIFNGEDGHLCIEPISCAANASELQAKGLLQASARFLQPGETVKGDYSISYQA